MQAEDFVHGVVIFLVIKLGYFPQIGTIRMAYTDLFLVNSHSV